MFPIKCDFLGEFIFHLSLDEVYNHIYNLIVEAIIWFL